MASQHDSLNTLSVAIVDSGIDVTRNEFRNTNITCINNCIDEQGHGTAVAAIIQRLAPDATFYIYKLFDNMGSVEPQDLVETLKFLSAYRRFDVIHLSCGVVACDMIQELYEVCEAITNSGTILVSAFDNAGAISYPAAFPNVIGVDWDKHCSEGTRYIFLENSPINILGVGSLQRLPWLNGEYKYVAGSSFAAPYITAIILNMIKNGIFGTENIRKALRENASSVLNNDNHLYKPKRTAFPIKCAILYPFNKEVHSLIAFEDMLPFRIHGLYEPALFRRVGKKASDVLGFCTSDITIQNDKSIDWNADFDTVILSHTKVISSAIGHDVSKDILEQCITYRKNVFSFDPLDRYSDQVDQLQRIGCMAYSPRIDATDVDRSFLNKLYGISTPVVGIFGTSSSQGKFSLQLALKKRLSEIGYRVGTLGTEPSASLLGLDATYPMGYESGVHISGGMAINVINRFMHEMDMKEYDILLAASQSQTVPYNMGNLGLYPVAQHEFLLGTEPDAIILCINPFDDVSYIQRTISYLQSYIETRVVALSLYPRKRSFEWAVQGSPSQQLDKGLLTERKNFYCQSIGIPCYLLGDPTELDELIDHVTDFFV